MTTGERALLDDLNSRTGWYSRIAVRPAEPTSGIDGRGTLEAVPIVRRRGRQGPPVRGTAFLREAER